MLVLEEAAARENNENQAHSMQGHQASSRSVTLNKSDVAIAMSRHQPPVAEGEKQNKTKTDT